MTANKLSNRNRSLLRKISTATLTTCLFKRGFRNTWMPQVQLVNSSAPRMIGEAFTLRTIPAREDIDTLEIFKDLNHPQRKAIEEIPKGHVLVIDSRRDPRAASAGAILVTRLWKRGAAGFVTDGGLRDSPEISDIPFPVYHTTPSAPTNLTIHHAVDINLPIGCAGVPVYPGDILVGDKEGVVVIPMHLSNEIAEEGSAMTDYEDWVLTQVKQGRSIFGIYPPNEEAKLQFESSINSKK